MLQEFGWFCSVLHFRLQGMGAGDLDSAFGGSPSEVETKGLLLWGSALIFWGSLSPGCTHKTTHHHSVVFFC